MVLLGLATMERYQLSQDFQEKQLQVLQRKYGGAQASGHAALTIQRAFRRYSMAKKFADLTAQVKNEKRISRRLDPPPPAPPPSTTPSTRQYEELCAYEQEAARYASPQGTPKSRQPSSASSTSASSQQGYKCSNCNPQAGVTESPDLQSFSLDETSVYGHGHSQQQQHSQHVSQHPQHVPSSAQSSQMQHPHPHVVLPPIAPPPHHQHLQHHQPHYTTGLTRQHSHPTTALGATKREESPQSNGRLKSRRNPSGGHEHAVTSSLNASATPVAVTGAKSRRTASSSSMRGGYPYGGSGQDVLDNSGASSRQFRQASVPAAASNASFDQNSYTVNEVIRKRHYRTGLNIFNKKPEKGIAYLIKRGFLENSPSAVARFLITRKGLSKQMIGEYLGNINHAFNSAVLTCFAAEMDFTGLHIDTALRKFQTYFRMPGEAQKIERLMEVFSSRFCQCQPELMSKLHSADTMFILAFAIILLNTDLHTQSLKPEKRMKLNDFVRNLRGIDDGHDLDHDFLMGIYDRIRTQEFRPGSDHVTQVVKVQQTIVAKCPNLAIPHRRLVCYCRLYEIHDPYKKERPGVHQREVFLFNDILVVTKIHSRKKTTVTYAFRQSYVLAGMIVNLFETQFYPFGIQIAQKWDRKVVLMLNARNDHDRSKFVEDLKESIAEMDEMEALRLEAELEKQKQLSNTGDNRDSGINNDGVSVLLGAGEELGSAPSGAVAKRNSHSRAASTGGQHHSASPSSQVQLRSGSHQHHHHGGAQMAPNGVVLRRSAINNSLLDLSEASAEKMTRRASVGSLDSGMSVSFQSTSVNSFQLAAAQAAAANGGARKSEGKRKS